MSFRQIRVGTSGWHYDHWMGRFYPERLPKPKWLEFYSKEFDTVELNNTFYRLPNESTFEKWHDSAPDNFIFTVKASRYITHIKKLHEASDSVELFNQRAALLGEKLGPVLYQLPPNYKKDAGRLRDFLELLSKDVTNVFEFRNNSWYDDEIFDLLDKYKASFCVHDLGGKEAPLLVTGKIVYLRFHGSADHSGDYTLKNLEGWVEFAQKHAKKTISLYAYFNNDINAYAVKNAKMLRDLLR